MNRSFPETGNWYRGNTHLHTTRSDGVKDPADAVEEYKRKGYDFVVISDHVRYFNNSELDGKDFLVVPGVELHVERENEGILETHHVTGMYSGEGEPFGHDHVFSPGIYDGKDTTPVQNMIDTLKAQSNFVIYAHPDWSRTTPETMGRLKGLDAMEVWNHQCDFCCGNGDGTMFWDILLRKGMRLWGVAADDRHIHDERGLGGFIMVKAPELSVKEIVRAMKAGSFYSSNGPEIHDFHVDGGVAYAQGSPVRKVTFFTDGHSSSTNGKTENHTVDRGTFRLSGKEKFVRVEFMDHTGKRAWSNPLYL
ncbi:MAG: CehA/McbA family metallohydrolase [Clostridia bacterium]